MPAPTDVRSDSKMVISSMVAFGFPPCPLVGLPAFTFCCRAWTPPFPLVLSTIGTSVGTDTLYCKFPPKGFLPICKDAFLSGVVGGRPVGRDAPPTMDLAALSS